MKISFDAWGFDENRRRPLSIECQRKEIDMSNVLIKAVKLSKEEADKFDDYKADFKTFMVGISSKIVTVEWVDKL